MRKKRNIFLTLIVVMMFALFLPENILEAGTVKAAKLNTTSKVLVKGKSFQLNLKGAEGKVKYKSKNSLLNRYGQRQKRISRRSILNIY